MNQSVRIIGGLYRGKKLSFPETEGLRPTSDRLRETLFNWLMHDVRGARCLDAFAGSGALGFEALSRGADRVLLIEQAKVVFNNLQKLARSFPTDRLSLRHEDAFSYLQSTQDCFDLVFLDPPFASDLLQPCVEVLSQRSVLAVHGLMYTESPCRLDLDPAVWALRRSKQSPRLVCAVYEKLLDKT